MLARTFAVLVLGVPLTVFARTPKHCVTAEQATKMLNKDVCISAHIYDVVQLADGTRFLDVCSPDTPDDKCRFTIVSCWDDRKQVGRAESVPRSECADSRDCAADARPRRDDLEPRAAVLWQAAKVPPQSPARAWLRCRGVTPAG